MADYFYALEELIYKYDENFDEFLAFPCWMYTAIALENNQ